MQSKASTFQETVLFVALGGLIGVGIRYGLLLVNQKTATTSFIDEVYLLLIINVLGSGLLGFLLACRSKFKEKYMALLGTGLCGGLTTFSGFAVTVAQELNQEEISTATLIALATPLGCLVAAGLGFRAGKVSL